MLRRTLALFALTTFVAGCSMFAVSPRRAGSGRASSGTTTGTTAPPPTTSTVPADPRQALEETARYMASLGFNPVGAAVHNNHMQQRGLIAYAIDGRRGSCFVAVAFGAPGTDLDMTVVGPMGRPLGHDVAPDTHPYVVFCPRIRGRFLARLQMSAGAGEYYYIVFEGGNDPGEQLASFMGRTGGVAGAPAQQVATIDGATNGRLSRYDADLGRNEYTRVGAPQGFVMGPRQDRQYPLNLRRGYCYAFATLGGAGTVETHAAIVDGGGSTLAQDTGAGTDAVVEFCPRADGEYVLRAILADGSGPVFVAGWVRPDRSAAAPTTPPVADATPDIIGPDSSAGAGLDENFRLLQADMQARGYEPYGDTSRGELAEGAQREFQIELEGGKCYAILAVGDNGVRDIDLIVRDRGGNIVDRDIEADARPVVRVCPESSGTQSIDVRMASGGGEFVYAAYRWPRGTRGPFGLAGLIWVRTGEVTSLLQVDGYALSEDIMLERGTLRRTGDRRSHTLNLQAGRCYAVVVVGGAGVNDLDVSISAGGTEVAADSSRNAFPDLRFCSDRGGRHELSVTAANGSGAYLYQVYERTGS